MVKEKIINYYESTIKLNLDIFLVYIFINFYFLFSISIQKPDINYFYNILFILVNTLIVSSVYLLNKVSDKEEDAINNSYKYLNPDKVWKYFIFSFSASLLVYLYLNLWLFFAWLIFLSLGYFYSYPKEFRLKNIFILKNFIPSFCWYLSLVLLVYQNFPDLNPLNLVTGSLPLFFIFFIFEIFWDLPDISGDRQSKVQTLPVFLGFTLTKALLILSLSVFLIITTSMYTKILFSVMILFLILVNRQTSKKIYHIVPLIFSFILFLIFIFKFFFS